ncbi:MAG: hypothetical protein II766_03595 [Paludibacteraceae bacterium]|nr:hypothetical protein [Paludibacteraceae bacterium]
MRPNAEDLKAFVGKKGEESSRVILLCETGLCDTNWSADIYQTAETLKEGDLCSIERNARREMEVRWGGKRIGLLSRPTSVITGNLQEAGIGVAFSVRNVEDRGNAVEITGALWMIV